MNLLHTYGHAEVDAVTNTNHARLALVHTHILKLTDAGVIEYDQRSETIRYQNDPLLEAILAVATTHGV